MGKYTDKTCCFTGHRIISPGEESKILIRVRHRLIPLIQSGVTYFGVGGALGFDTMMADLLLELKKENSRMRIIEVLPYEGYRAKIVYVSKEPSRGAYLARGRHLVDGSRYCISYCNKPTGGTAFTVKYALERGLTVYNASSFDVNTLLGHKTLGNS